MPICKCHAGRGRSLVIPVGNPSNEDPPFGASDAGPQDGKVGIPVSVATGKPVSDDKGFTTVPVRHTHRRLFGGGFHCFTLDTQRTGGCGDYLS